MNVGNREPMDDVMMVAAMVAMASVTMTGLKLMEQMSPNKDDSAKIMRKSPVVVVDLSWSVSSSWPWSFRDRSSWLSSS